MSRVYDEEWLGVGLRTTRYARLRLLSRSDVIRQRDLGGLTFLNETTLTRNLRHLVDSGWVAASTGEDRREKLVQITEAGAAKLEEARPAWDRAQERMRSLLPEGLWSDLLSALPGVARLAGDA